MAPVKILVNLNWNCRIGDWCSGSTRGFDLRGIGSIPISPANFYLSL